MGSAGDIKARVSDPRLIEERRGQILRAAVKLFSEDGYYTTTIQQIAKQAGISTGLIYQYFHDKDDILFLCLKMVLDSYEHEIPTQLDGIADPVERLCVSVWAYCHIVDRLREATVLAYRSTKSLRADRRVLIKEAETRTNRLIETALKACIDGGHMQALNHHLLAYQLVLYAHAWALKHWALDRRYSLERYIGEGIALLVEPFLTARGRRALGAVALRKRSFTSMALTGQVARPADIPTRRRKRVAA
jgi:AcrR family transcriptional regulator